MCKYTRKTLYIHEYLSIYLIPIAHKTDFADMVINQNINCPAYFMAEINSGSMFTELKDH